MTKHRAHGFNLIELMIALAIAATLLVLAGPNYATWIADGQIRAAAESIVSGMRYAQAESVKRNEPVEFVLDPTTGTGGWVVQLVDGTDLQVGVFAEGAVLAAFVTTPGTATITTFNSLGGVNTANADLTVPIQLVAITHSGTVANTRPLTVQVAGGRSGIKLCDPAETVSTSPRFCTAQY